MSVILDLIVATLWLWVLYSLLSTAFALSFRVGGFFDLSVGVSFLVGAYASYALVGAFPILVSVALAVLLAAAGAAIIGKLLIAPLAVRVSALALFVATLAMLYVAQAAAGIVFGESAVVLRGGPAPVIHLGGISLTDVQLAIGVVTVVAMALLGRWLKISPWGRYARAIADDRCLAAQFGVPVDATILRCYGIGGALAGLAGAGFIADRAVDPSQALTVLLAAMVAAIIGGEAIFSAVTGALILAVLETVLGFLLPGNWKTTVAFSVLLLVLIVRSGAVAQLAQRRI